MMKYKAILLLLLVGSVKNCEEQDATLYMDAAIGMIQNAKQKLSQDHSSWYQLSGKHLDCADLLLAGYKKSGVYSISPVSRVSTRKSFSVYCDMDTDGGGWTVIQRRGNFNRSIDYFNQDWKSYKEGFGNIAEEFWLGNDNIFALTNQKMNSVRFDLRNMKLVKRFAQYDAFWIDDEFHNYTLHISGYKGDAGDSMINHNETPFSTKDKDNDENEDNCAAFHKSGWWFHNCYRVNLNGQNKRGSHEEKGGIHWREFSAYNDSLESAEIKIRPITTVVNSKMN